MFYYTTHFQIGVCINLISTYLKIQPKYLGALPVFSYNYDQIFVHISINVNWGNQNMALEPDFESTVIIAVCLWYGMACMRPSCTGVVVVVRGVGLGVLVCNTTASVDFYFNSQ